MSVRASIRRIERFEAKLREQGIDVLNLCGRGVRLCPLQGPNEALPRCYAAVLGNCTGPISREHYISENILKQLDTVNLDAFPSLKGRCANIAPKDLAANCLCKYHNEFLSPLDQLAGQAFDNFQSLLAGGSPSVLVWGPSLARWCLKALVGLVGAKQVVVDGEKVLPADLPKDWIEILFGLRDFPIGQGLYMTPVVGQCLTVSKRIKLETLLLDGRLQGVRVGVAGVDFLLSMADPERAFNRVSPAFESLLYRPCGINLDQRRDRVRIFWE